MIGGNSGERWLIYLSGDDPDEVKQVVDEVVKELGATTIKDMGRVMKAVLAKVPTADGAVVSSLVKERLK